MCYIEASYYIHCTHLNVHFWTCTDLEHGHLRPKSVMHSYHRLCPMCFKEKYVSGERERVEDVDETAVESESEDILEEVPAATRPPPMTTEPSFSEFMAWRGWMTTTPTRLPAPASTSTVVSDRRNARGGDEVAPATVTHAARRQLQEQAAIELRMRRLAVLHQSPDIGDVGRSLLTERERNTMTDVLLADAVSWPPQVEEARRDLAILIGAREDARRMNQSEPADVGMFMEAMEQRLHNHLEDTARARYLLLSARSSGSRFSEAGTNLDTTGVGTTGGLTQQEGSVANGEDSSNIWFHRAAHLSHSDAVVSVRVATTLEELLHPELQHVEFPPATIVSHPDVEISGRVVTTLQELIDPANLRDQRNIQRHVEALETGVLRAQQEAEQAASGLLQTRESLAGWQRQRGRAAVGGLLQIAAERSMRNGETRQATVEPTLPAVAEDQRLGQPEAQRRDAAQGAQTTTQRRGRANRPMQQRRRRRRPDPAGVPVSSPQGREQEDQDARQVQQVLNEQLARVRTLDRRNNRMRRMLEPEILDETTRSEARVREAVRHLHDLPNNPPSDMLRQEHEELLRELERGLERLSGLSRLADTRLRRQEPYRAGRAEEEYHSGHPGQYSLDDIEHRLGMSLGNPTAGIATQQLLNYERARSMRNSASASQQLLVLGQGEVSHFPSRQPRPGAGRDEDEDVDMRSREESYYSTAEGEIAEESAVGSNPENPDAMEQGQPTAPGQMVSEQGVDSDDQMQFVGIVEEAVQSADHSTASCSAS